MLVSIITPVWNQYRITDRFYMLSSIHLASYIQNVDQDIDVEFVTVNNGSVDETAVRLALWNNQFNGKIKIVSLPENVGFGAGHNTGAREASGDILIHVSNDVMPYGDYVAPVVQAIAKDKHSLYGARLLNEDTGWNSFDRLDKPFIPYLEGWFLACHRDLWQTLGGFDEQYYPCDYEDLDLSYTASNMGIDLKELPIDARHFSGQTASRELSKDRTLITKHNRILFMDKWKLGGNV